jgi:tetratricopeptide (TPR) repeat protein
LTLKWVRTGLALAFIVAAVGGGARAWAGPDPREIQARQDFVEGRYQEALDLFARLYAETLHPNYLRNIGRCYQNLQQPDRAISNFRDYLHKAKQISPAERQEVEGYIKEMEDLKAQREREAKGAAPTEPAPVTPLPTAPPPATATAPAVITAAPAADAPAAEPPSPFYARWWFWAIVGSAVAIGVGAAAAAGAFTKTQDAACPMGVSCH